MMNLLAKSTFFFSGDYMLSKSLIAPVDDSRAANGCSESGTPPPRRSAIEDAAGYGVA